VNACRSPACPTSPSPKPPSRLKRRRARTLDLKASEASLANDDGIRDLAHISGQTFSPSRSTVVSERPSEAVFCHRDNFATLLN
jgi:hypothetical protein